MDESSSLLPSSREKQRHASTYTPGEDSNRLASAAQYFGIQNAREPLRPIRENSIIPETDAMIQERSVYASEQDSRSILKFGSTVWHDVGLIFSDSTLEAARMHSVGVTAQEEHVSGDGTLHLRSVVRRMKKKKSPVVPLGEMFKPPIEPVEIEEEEEYEEVIIESVEGGSIEAAIFGIIKGMVGPAILYLPRGFSISGFAVAVPAMICAAITYLYCANRLLQCWKSQSDKTAKQMERIRLLVDPESSEGSLLDNKNRTQGQLLTYSELARRAFGDFGVLISGGIAGMQFGVCLTYLIFVPQNLYELIRNIFGINVPKGIILIGMLAVEIPLVWIRDIRKLTPFNILATVLIAFGLASVLFIAVFNDQARQDSNLLQELSQLPAIENTWALFIGTSFFCFEGSITLLVPLQEAVYSQKNRSQFPSVNRNVTSSIILFYIVFALICWASFGDTVQTALTASLPKGTLSSMVQFAYSIAVIFTFPLQAFPALEVVCNTTHTKAGRNKTSEAIIFRRNVTATIIVCLLGFVAEISTNYLGNVVSLIGSFVGIPIALIYPPLMHNKLVPESSVLTKVLNICLAVVGLFAAGAASYTTIVSWNEGAEG